MLAVMEGHTVDVRVGRRHEGFSLEARHVIQREFITLRLPLQFDPRREIVCGRDAGHSFDVLNRAHISTQLEFLFQSIEIVLDFPHMLRNDVGRIIHLVAVLENASYRDLGKSKVHPLVVDVAAFHDHVFEWLSRKFNDASIRMDRSGLQISDVKTPRHHDVNIASVLAFLGEDLDAEVIPFSIVVFGIVVDVLTVIELDGVSARIAGDIFDAFLLIGYREPGVTLSRTYERHSKTHDQNQTAQRAHSYTSKNGGKN